MSTMRQRRPRTRQGRRLLSTLLLGACSVSAVVNLGRLFVQEGRLIGQQRVLLQQRRQEDRRRQALLDGIRDAKSIAGVEHLARTSLALARPGEVQVVYLPGANPVIAKYPVPPTPVPAASTPPALVATAGR
ncbi:MAG: hypothetical protein KGR26_09055 [Cyanobacteria bacterium REEB65]|nr:hypothetical protein [Cyanobacteria bacterium REEB65]